MDKLQAINLVKMASVLDNLNEHFISDKLIKIAQDQAEFEAGNPGLYTGAIGYVKAKLIEKYRQNPKDQNIESELKGELQKIIDSNEYKSRFSDLKPAQSIALNEQAARIIEQIKDLTISNLSKENLILSNFLSEKHLDLNSVMSGNYTFEQFRAEFVKAKEDLAGWVQDRYPNSSYDFMNKLIMTLKEQLDKTFEMYLSRVKFNTPKVVSLPPAGSKGLTVPGTIPSKSDSGSEEFNPEDFNLFSYNYIDAPLQKIIEQINFNSDSNVTCDPSLKDELITIMYYGSPEGFLQQLADNYDLELKIKDDGEYHLAPKINNFEVA